MSQIKLILRMRLQGKGIKTITTDLQISKNTVKTYLKKVEDGGYRMEELLELEGPVLEARFHAGNVIYSSRVYLIPDMPLPMPYLRSNWKILSMH